MTRAGTCASAQTAFVDVTPDAQVSPDRRAELILHGRVLPASNATFFGEIDGVRVVYKPIKGERPLWDFPDGTLAGREVAAYLVSEVLGWQIVPPTILRDGPHGPGMVQRWCEIDETQPAVRIVPHGSAESGWCRVVDGLDAADQLVSLVHEDSASLRRMAVFDVVVNNADRKGGHVLAMPDGHRHGVDHGLTFHVEDKLRTVLWGWSGERLNAEEHGGLSRLRAALEAGFDEELAPYLTELEMVALSDRTRRLCHSAVLPAPGGSQYPAIPWPPM